MLLDFGGFKQSLISIAGSGVKFQDPGPPGFGIGMSRVRISGFRGGSGFWDPGSDFWDPGFLGILRVFGDFGDFEGFWWFWGFLGFWWVGGPFLRF